MVLLMMEKLNSRWKNGGVINDEGGEYQNMVKYDSAYDEEREKEAREQIRQRSTQKDVICKQNTVGL